MGRSNINHKKSKSLPKRFGARQINKLFKFSAWLLMVLSIVAIIFGIFEYLRGLSFAEERHGQGFEVILSLIAWLIAVPMLLASIYAFKYIYNKEGGKLTTLAVCLFWAIAPYVLYILFSIIVLYNFKLVELLLLIILPDILFIIGCYLECWNRSKIKS